MEGRALQGVQANMAERCERLTEHSREGSLSSQRRKTTESVHPEDDQQTRAATTVRKKIPLMTPFELLLIILIN